MVSVTFLHYCLGECDIHLSDILSSDFYCTLLFFDTIELICCLITYLQQSYLPVYIIPLH